MFTTIKEMRKYTDNIIEVLRINHERILSCDDSDNAQIFDIFVKCDNNYQTMKQQLGFIKYVSGDWNMKEESVRCENMLLFYNVDLLTNTEMYIKLVNFYNKNKTSLTDLQLRYLKKVIVDFKRSGAELSKSKTHELKIIEKKIIELQQQIILNVNKSDVFVKITSKDIEGIPEKEIKLLKYSNGKYTIPLNKFYYKLCMKYIHNANIRKKIDREYNNICATDNNVLLSKILLLNNKKALLLKKESYIHYAYEPFMVNKISNAKLLLKNIVPEIESSYLDEMRILLNTKSKTHSSQRICAWDISYLFNKIEKIILGIDISELDSYFPLHRIINISFNICKYMFEVSFSSTNDATWDKQVSSYNVYDVKTNKIIGTLYLDLFERKYKYKDNMCYTVIPYYSTTNTEEKQEAYEQLPCVAILMNLREIECITHQQAVDYLHLLGEALHKIFGKIEYCRLSGNNIDPDLVKCWPYILEKWFWMPDVLYQLEHYKTKQKIPKQLVDNLIKTKTIKNGFKYKKMLSMIYFDHVINDCEDFMTKLKNIYNNSTNNSEEIGDVIKNIYDIVRKKVFRSKKINISKFKIKFDTLVSIPAQDYDFLSQTLKQFCHFWSRIYADDIFNTKFKNNVFSTSVSMDFKNKILDKGWSESHSELVKKFVGRDTELESFYAERFFVIRDEIFNKQENTNEQEKVVQITC